MRGLLVIIRQRLTPVIMALIITTALVPSDIANAATNQLVITPTPTQMNIGSELTFSVKAYIDTSTSQQTASGSIAFPAAQLQAKNAVSSGWAGSPVINSGTINFNMSRSSSSTGFSTIFTVTFRAIGAGTAVVGFGGDSRVNGALTEYKSAVISVANPNPNPSSTPKPSVSVKPSVAPVPVVPSTTPTPTAEPSEEAEPAPSPDPSGVVDGVLVKPLYNSATITWSVNASNPRSTFIYGSKASLLDQSSEVTRTADGTFVTTITNLEPGNRYYFSINGTGDGGKDGTYANTVIASGYPITISVTENDIAAKNATIKIGTRSYTTSSSGKKTIGLAAGTYELTITTETATKTFELVVAKKNVPSDGSAPESQSFAYNLTSSPLAQGPGSGTTILAFIGALIGGTVLIGLGFVGFMAYRRRRFESGNNTRPSSTVIIDDGYDWRQEASLSNTPPEVPSPPATHGSPHHNSVFIDEAEPLDMFEQKKQ